MRFSYERIFASGQDWKFKVESFCKFACFEYLLEKKPLLLHLSKAAKEQTVLGKKRAKGTRPVAKKLVKKFPGGVICCVMHIYTLCLSIVMA